MDDLNPAVRSLWRLIHVLDSDLVDGRSQQEVIQTIDRQGSQREVIQTVDRTNLQRHLIEAVREDSKYVLTEGFQEHNHDRFVDNDQTFADNNQTFADVERDGTDECVDNWTCVRRGNYSQTDMTDRQAAGSRNMLNVRPCVVPRPTAPAGPVPRTMPINWSSALRHQGWLTDQLRGQRVWCSVSVNQLCISQGTDSTLVRQVILLPDCRVQHVELKSSNQPGKTHNGIARRFMSTSFPRLDQFNFLLENLRTGQHFLFGVDSQCELSEWRATLDTVCSLHSSTDVADSQTPGHASRPNNQMKHACSQPQISTHVAQDQLSDPTTSFTTMQLEADTIYPVQSDHAKVDQVQSDHAKVDPVQSDHGKVDPVQSDHGKIDLVQSDHGKVDLVQSDHGKVDLVQSDHRKVDLVQHGEKTDLVQHGEKTDLVQHGEKTDLVQHGEKTDLVQHGEKTDLVQHGEKTDLVQHGEKTDSLENLRRIRDKPETSNTKYPSVKVNHTVNQHIDKTVNHDVNYNVNYGTNHGANTTAAGSSTNRQARPELRIKPPMGALCPRRSRSASTGSSRQSHSLSDLQTHGNVADPSRAPKADSSVLDLEITLHKKRSFDARHDPPVASRKQHGHSKDLSFSFPRLTATSFGGGTFYKDVIPRPTGTTVRDLRGVCLSGHLLCATGCHKLRLVYCALSRGSLYMFSSATPGAFLERTVALNQYTVTYGSEMHERRRSLFLLKLTQPGGDSLRLYAETQQALLTWLMAMQSASVRLQSVEDLVSETRDSKQAVDVTSAGGQCRQGCQGMGCDKRQACVHGDVSVAALSPLEALEHGKASEFSEMCSLSTQAASEFSEMCSLSTQAAAEFSEPCNLSTLAASEFSEPCYPSTLKASSANSNDTPLQLVVPVSLRRLETPPRPQSTPGLFNSCLMSLDCEQRESSRLCEMSTDVLHKDNTETWSGRPAPDTSVDFQSLSQSAPSLSSPTLTGRPAPNTSMDFQSLPQSAPSLSSPTLTGASFLNASTEVRAGGVHQVGPGVCPCPVPAVGVSVSHPGVCPCPVPAVGVSEHPSVAFTQHHHNGISCSAVARTHLTNHNTVLDARDVRNQSLLHNLDQSKADARQPYQFQSLVHDDAVKRAWATTEQNLLEVVKEKLRQRERRGILQTELCRGCHDVCIAEDDWNLADRKMLSLPGLLPASQHAKWKNGVVACHATDIALLVTDSNQWITDSCHPLTDSNQQITDGCHPLTDSNQQITDSCHPLTDSNRQITDSCHPLTDSVPYMKDSIRLSRPGDSHRDTRNVP